jgi:hypothetical protein
MSTISLLIDPSFVENPINQSNQSVRRVANNRSTHDNEMVGLINSNSAQSTEELPEPSPDMPSLRAEERSENWVDC